jgi:hypothetical protein
MAAQSAPSSVPPRPATSAWAETAFQARYPEFHHTAALDELRLG